MEDMAQGGLGLSTEENMDLIEELVCSQEEWSHTHLAPRKISEQTGISWSVINMQNGEKKRNLKQFKGLKPPQKREGTRNRRETRAGSLRKRFESNIYMIEKMVWQDEKDFTLEVPVNLQNNCIYIKGKKIRYP